MITNVAGGMADIASAAGEEIDDADLALGEDIAERYRGLWSELHHPEHVGQDERYRITERIRALNELGFEVDDVAVAAENDGAQLRFTLRVGSRRYHRNQLQELTGIWTSEKQARDILGDMHYYLAHQDTDQSASGKAVGAIRWRVGVFEPLLERIRSLPPNVEDPVQAYTDFLHHRFVMSQEAGRDVGNEVAFADWVERGQPGLGLFT